MREYLLIRKSADKINYGQNLGEGMQIDFEASKVVPTANENKPVNYVVNYYIKY